MHLLSKMILGLALLAPAAIAETAPAAPLPRTPQPVKVNPLVQEEWDTQEDLRHAWYRQPDLLGFSAGYYDVLAKDDAAVDFRAEFRSGYSMLRGIAPRTFSGWDRYVQIRPMVGVEGTSDGAVYGYGGFVLDAFLTPNIFLSPNLVAGLYYNGNGKRLGSVVEFRSTLEAGYRFDNNWRLSASFGHISNAGFGNKNPGTEILSGNFYVPTSAIFGE